MSRPYLFGPVSAEFAEQNLQRHCAAGLCRTFDHGSDADISLERHSTWSSFAASLPQGFQPEFITLWLPYRTIPGWLLSAPVPLVGLAGDWNVLWHHYRRLSPRLDLVISDTRGVELLRAPAFRMRLLVSSSAARVSSWRTRRSQ